MERPSPVESSNIAVSERDVSLPGSLVVPRHATGVVVFAHDSGSSRLNPRDRAVARALNECGLATLLFDLLTPEENGIDHLTGGLRFDIELLSQRLVGAIDWLGVRRETGRLPVGIFGSSIGAAAALRAAAARPERVAAVICRGGRPDLAGDDALGHVEAPTLLIVGGEDAPVIAANQAAGANLHCVRRLDLVPGATHHFEEPGKLEQVAKLASEWFLRHMEKFDFSC
ncbi:MAG: dienelactone hydrolase family protein [Betaproteobacteria bacterium]|nr:dienelactone hydrolase family protein [Betaproteobacteria bacterium]